MAYCAILFLISNLEKSQIIRQKFWNYAVDFVNGYEQLVNDNPSGAGRFRKRSLINVFNKLTSRQALNHANEISDIILL